MFRSRLLDLVSRIGVACVALIGRIADWSDRHGTPDNGATETTARPARMVSHDPIKDYMRRHACGFPDALDALAAQLGPPTPTTSDALCGPWAGPGRRWICLRRWNPGAPTKAAKRRDRPRRL